MVEYDRWHKSTKWGYYPRSSTAKALKNDKKIRLPFGGPETFNTRAVELREGTSLLNLDCDFCWSFVRIHHYWIWSIYLQDWGSLRGNWGSLGGYGMVYRLVAKYTFVPLSATGYFLYFSNHPARSAPTIVINKWSYSPCKWPKIDLQMGL